MTSSRLLILAADDSCLQGLYPLQPDLCQTIELVQSRDDALRCAALCDYAVMLIDTDFPSLDGFEVAESIRAVAKCAKPPIIFITSYAEGAAARQRGYALGTVDFVSKPVTANILRGKIAIFAELYELHQQVLQLTLQTKEQNPEETHARSRELESINLKLEASNQELEQFGNITSHDLRDPLRTITNLIRLLSLRLEGILDADAQKYMLLISDGAERMKQLIHAMMEISRVGRHEFVLESVWLSQTLDRVRFGLQDELVQAEAIITLKTDRRVRASALLLQQLLQNLIGNALKFRSADSPKIIISVEERDHEWLFSVKDNGIGIKPTYREYVFQIFQKLHKPTEYPGTGIGLAICEKIVRKHAGRIWFESDGVKGTEFFFTIPL